LFQMLDDRGLASLARVVGVVEPFFLSDAGSQAPGAEEFQAYVAEHPGIPFVASCSELPEPKRPRVAVIATRTKDLPVMFEEAILVGKCSHAYIEKPGATEAAELERMRALAEKHGAGAVVGYARNGSAFAVGAHDRKREEPDAEVTLLHFNDFARTEEALSECFSRNSEGFMKNTLCHDFAIAVHLYGLRADSLCDLKVDAKTELATHGGLSDFVTAAFSLRPAPGERPLHFWGTRCAPENVMACEVTLPSGKRERFSLGNPPPPPCPCDGLNTILATQYELYINGKRNFLESIVAGHGKTYLLSLSDSAEVLRIAEKANTLVRAALG